MADEYFYNSNLIKIPYALVRKAMQETHSIPYTMSLVGDDAQAVIRATNQGIDAHLEACYCPDRGDKFEREERKIGDKVVQVALACEISAESLPTLLRRLSELEYEEDDEACGLVDSILSTIGIDDRGKFSKRNLE